MDLATCRAVRDEITARSEAMRSVVEKETLDSLAKYCRSVKPDFAGRYNNVGLKVSQIAEATKRAYKEKKIDWVHRALKDWTWLFIIIPLLNPTSTIENVGA